MRPATATETIAPNAAGYLQITGKRPVRPEREVDVEGCRPRGSRRRSTPSRHKDHEEDEQTGEIDAARHRANGTRACLRNRLLFAW